MSKEKQSGCCLWRIIKFFLILFFIGGVFYCLFCYLGLVEIEDYDYKKPIKEIKKEIKKNLPPSYSDYTGLDDNNEINFVDEEYIDYYKIPIDEKDFYVSTSNYNYAKVAEHITSGCENNYQKIRAIYQWICENIDYDTSYTIHRADSCYDARKGVCQAYCELFYQIAKAAGVKVEIISGMSKDLYGNIGQQGHAWLFAYTRDNYGILLDPTWGAGTVGNSTFTRRGNCWIWFNVNPEWMILSHFPNDESYQLIDSPMSYEEFLSLVPVSSLWVEYGIDVRKIYKKIRKKELNMPEFYGRGEGKFEIIDMPMCNTLRLGETYTFRIKKKTANDFAIINGKIYETLENWKDEGVSVYSIDYLVRNVGTVKLSMKVDYENLWYDFIEYRVELPPNTDRDAYD